MNAPLSDSSTATQAPRAPDIKHIGPYEVVSTLGRGGMGSVYAVRHKSAFGVERLLAAKVLSAQLLGERHFVNMFIDEARIATLLQHPNVVATYDVMDHEGAPVIVMELLRGRSLDHLLRRAPQLSRPVLLAILARAARGLGAVHETRGADGQLLRVVHRDVSPQNIQVGYDGQVKIIDFGIAAARGRVTTTRTGEVKGKLAYLAPEQLAQGNLDHRTDLFALGVVAWEAFAGRRLFKQADEAKTMWAVVNKPIPHLGEVAADVPPAVADVIASCLCRNPRDRPASARAVAKVFAEAAPGVEESEIGALVCEVFAEERLEDDARLVAPAIEAEAVSAASVSSGPGVGADSGATGAPTVSAVSGQAGRGGRGRAWMIAGAIAVALATLVAVTLKLGSSAAEPLPAAVQPTSVPAVAATPRETFQVRIGDDVKLVLVAGKRRDERPLMLDVERGSSVEVSLVGSDGRVVERRVDAASADTLLTLAAPEAPPPPVAPAAASAKHTKSASRAPQKSVARVAKTASGLIGNPY